MLHVVDCYGVLQNAIFKLNGESDSISTKIVDQDNCNNNCLVTSRVFDSGKHRISFKLIKGEASHMFIYCGLVRDGAAWNANHTFSSSTTGWFMDSVCGSLYGHGKEGDDRAGEIKSGQILTIEADLDKGTLRFWVAGKPHGPGYTSGVTGRLRFATTVVYKGSSVQIVPTPELSSA
jgi:hypothetical protein